MWQTIKNLVITTFVAVFVWIFAESETLREEKMSATLALVTVPNARYSFMTETQARQAGVEVWVETGSSRMDSVERRLRRPLELLAGRGAVPAAPGEHTVDLAEALRENTDLAAMGISIRRVEPASLRVVIDELVTRELPVRLPAEVGEFESAPVVSPPTVKITMPARDMARLTPRDHATVLLTPELVEQLPSGKSETLRGLGLRAPFDIADREKMVFDPTSVDVTVTRAVRGREIVLAQVPVYVRLAPDQLLKWNIALAPQDQFLENVRVSGPEELIEQVRNRTLPVAAVVTLTVEELERGITAQTVNFADMPEGLRVESPTRSVRLSVTRR